MHPDRSPRKWISAGLAVMFVLIGVVAILSILLFRGTYPSTMDFRFGWFLIIGPFPFHNFEMNILSLGMGIQEVLLER